MPDDLITKALAVTVSKVDAPQRIVAGWAFQDEIDGDPVVDLQHDHISVEQAAKAVHGWVESGGAIQLAHEPGVVGRAVEAVLVDDNFAKAAFGLEPGQGVRGLWIAAKITDHAAWERLTGAGDKLGFSIGGRGRRV